MRLSLLMGFLLFAQIISAQSFTEIQQSPALVGLFIGSAAFSDVDGDGDQDLLITGDNNSGIKMSKLFINDGTGKFNEKPGTPFEGVWHSSAAFSDIDGDGDQDLLITGESNSGRISKMYTNDGAGNFTELVGTPFVGVKYSSVAFSDVDGDGDQDLLIIGVNNLFKPISKLYANDGSGIFTEITDTPFKGVALGSVAFSDVDSDGDQDLFITGYINYETGVSNLYINDGMGNFTEMTDTPFDQVLESSIAVADIDGDEDQDILITGRNNSRVQISKLYTNDGAGNFDELIGTRFDGVKSGSVAFSDVDGDGDQDFLITGLYSHSRGISKLHINDGAGNFSEITGTPFESVYFSSVAFSDVDGDGDEDLLIMGANHPGKLISKLYANDRMATSTNELYKATWLDIKAYPNPGNSSNLHLSYKSAESSFVTISIYKLNGHLMSQKREFATMGQQTFTIGIATLPQGSYFIQLENGEQTGIAQFIIE